MKKTFILLALLFPLMTFGQSRSDILPPKWLYGHVPSGSGGIEFKVIRIPYNGYADVSASALAALGRQWVEEHHVSQKTTLNNMDIVERKNGQVVKGTSQQVSEIQIIDEGKPVTLRCMLVDDWMHKRGGDQEYCAVYELATRSNARFQPCTVSTGYGAVPVFMSLFPGAGQFYKGDALKGGLFLGGCVLGGAGIVFMESQRKACSAQREQTHDVNLIKKYAAQERNLSIARNVTIGITAALYIYNLIDAAVAPGARKIQLTPGGVSYIF